MASGDVINSIEEYDLKDLGAKKKTPTIDRSSYGKFYTPINFIGQQKTIFALFVCLCMC